MNPLFLSSLASSPIGHWLISVLHCEPGVPRTFEKSKEAP